MSDEPFIFWGPPAGSSTRAPTPQIPTAGAPGTWWITRRSEETRPKCGRRSWFGRRRCSDYSLIQSTGNAGSELGATPYTGRKWQRRVRRSTRAQCPVVERSQGVPGLCPTAMGRHTAEGARMTDPERYKHAQRELMEEAKSIAGVAEVAEVYARIAPAVDGAGSFCECRKRVLDRGQRDGLSRCRRGGEIAFSSFDRHFPSTMAALTSMGCVGSTWPN